MRTILAALDSSPAAQDVLRAAADIAAAEGARILLLRVVEGAAEVAGSNEALAAQARQQLRELARALPAGSLDGVIATLGDAWRKICAAAQSNGVDLVLLGTRPHTALERVLGTTATRVVNHCDRSVLVVRAWRGFPQHVLVALDGPAHSAEIREAAVALAHHARSKLRLFHAVDMPSVVPADMLEQFPTIEDAQAAAARKVLGPHEELVPAELRDGIAARHGASAWREICEAASEYAADLVVIGARGHGFTDRLLGTTANEIIHHASCSVLVVRRPWRDQGSA
jgi:nucleotide-binding universal stress UspA family protein